eukprot:CAMPEP_0181089466 /NCGR_PEP_ID=MMETSP1071-20121207/7320_1 /TAXON_ID=35127 /ORGANISM="Thalassiosira sp., Strain NH16" /LENGTH=825 /DNA_ID=CAMNT_0023171421 /DNA_START=8 /DNA_END=2485 /DNA_ORIENTATION=+
MASTAALTCPKIMQRPPSSAATAVLGACQTETVVVPSSGPATVGGSASTTAERGNADDGTTRPMDDAPSSMMKMASVKEEKKDDVHGIVLAETVAAPSAAEGPPPTQPSETTSWNPLEEVDSALLSAMCDPRERKALFRLEQVMVDFARDASRTYVEVGGAFNSIVLGGLNPAMGGVGGASSGVDIGQMAADGGQMMASTNSGGASSSSRQGQHELLYQQQRGMRQTSFQRLILHRLADRFDMPREQIGNNVNNNNNNNNNGGNERASLIRLIKTEASRVPSRLLIDIDLSLLIGYRNPRARNYGQGTNMAGQANGYDDGFAVRNLSEGVASATLAETQDPSPPNNGGKKSTKKKMVIMKRNSSSENGNNVDGSKGKQKGKKGRKKLEDRERAYEEARARIFAEEGGAPAEPQGAAQDPGENVPPPVPLSASSCHSSFSADPEAAAASPASSSAAMEHAVPSQLISASSPSTRDNQSRPPSPRGGQEPASPTSRATAPAEVAEPRLPSPPSSYVPAAAAATTGGAVNKAVYRNRQQEENDPDFKRRNDVSIRPTYVPYLPVQAAVAPNNPYGAPPSHQQQQQQQHPSSNPYATAMGGGGGQHRPQQQQQQTNPSQQQQHQQQQMIVAAMQHMQQQQASAAQQHHQHFYHGQQPGGNPFPTPQDASYAGSTNAVANNGNPQPQWAVQASSRGYYLSPPHHQQPQQHQQQQGQIVQQEKQHPQAWQPSGNNGGNNYGHGQQAVVIAHAPNNATDANQQHAQQQPSQPRIITHPPKVLWGPSSASGARGGAVGSGDAAQTDDVPSGARSGPTAAAEVSYTPEDFPALG